MGKRMPMWLAALQLAVGLGLMLYPAVSGWRYAGIQDRIIRVYQNQVKALTEEECRSLWEAAGRYNRKEGTGGYDHQLAPVPGGLLGYLEIPAIDVCLPVFHGTDETALETGVGHVPWSSLPTEALGTHCVLSGHRGLPSARLFTDLDRLRPGDEFRLHILERTQTYRVSEIRVVEPEAVSALAPREGSALCTLVTCTPYGINSHRLLVEGSLMEAP